MAALRPTARLVTTATKPLGSIFPVSSISTSSPLTRETETPSSPAISALIPTSLSGLPFTVKFQATGALANQSLAPTALGIPTGIMALGPDLGEAKAIPIVLTAVYQVGTLGPVTPYVGAGPALMFAADEKVTNAQLTEVSQPTMSIAPSPGVVLQAGLDAKITNRIYARLDLKFIALLRARATVDHIQVRTPDLELFDNVEVGTAKMNMWINPLIVQAGIGTDF